MKTEKKAFQFKKLAKKILIISVVMILGASAYLTVSIQGKADTLYRYQKAASIISDGRANDGELKEELNNMCGRTKDLNAVYVTDGENRIVYQAGELKLTDDKELTLIKDNHLDNVFQVRDNPDVVLTILEKNAFYYNSLFNRKDSKVASDANEQVYLFHPASTKVFSVSLLRSEDKTRKYFFLWRFQPAPQIGRAFSLLKGVLLLVFGFYWILLAAWMFLDARKRNQKPLFWGVVGLFGNVFGLLAYLLFKQTHQKCGRCHNLVSRRYGFCPQCGNTLGERCETCGAFLGKDTRFCGMCGNKVKRYFE